jgi:hypothetical protein
MTTQTLTVQEKIKKYDEMVEKRREYSRKHYNKQKEMIKHYKQLISKQK